MIEQLRHRIFKAKADVPIHGAADFYFDPDLLFTTAKNVSRMGEPEDVTIPLDLPYENCFFGAADNQPIVCAGQDDENYTQVNAIWCKEEAPGKYYFTAFVTNFANGKKHGEGLAFSHWAMHEDFNIESYKSTYQVTHYLCSVINDSARAELAPTGKKQKCWHNGQRAVYQPGRTVYIGPKRRTGTPKVAGCEFKRWIDAWRVRGHWRKCDGSLGKDRRGERCVEGYTWVSAHEKGEGKIMDKKYKVRA